MPIGPSKVLIVNQGSAGDSPDYVDAGDGNSVILEAWPLQAGVATVTVIDSADETTGFFPGVSPAAVQAGVTARTKVQVDNVLRYVKVRIAVSSGMWNVRVTPINSSGATAISATVTGQVNQGAPGSDSSLGWFVRVSDGFGVMPNGASSIAPVFVQPAYQPMVAGDRAQASGTAAVLVLGAVAGRRHVVGGVLWGCSDTPPAGTVVEILSGATLVRRWPVTSAGPGELVWPDQGTGVGAAMTIQMSALGGSIVGYVEALGHRLEA